MIHQAVMKPESKISGFIDRQIFFQDINSKHGAMLPSPLEGRR
jgi:hypothetical protein